MKVRSATQIETATNSKWPKHSLMKRLLNHRYKLVLLPLLGLPIPVEKNEVDAKVNPDPIVRKVEEQATQKYGFENKFVNYRLLPCTTSALILFTIMLGSEVFSSSDKKRNAVHEIGHLIAIKAVQYPTKIDFVAVEDSDLRINRVGHTPPNDYNILVDENGNPSLKRTLQNQIVLRAGEAMERLYYGYANDVGAYFDRFLNLIQKVGGTMYCLQLNPRKLRHYLIFLTRLEKYTQNILKQVGPETVNKLADRLDKQEYWSTDEVESIVKEFSFDKLPAFEETAQEIKKILE